MFNVPGDQCLDRILVGWGAQQGEIGLPPPLRRVFKSLHDEPQLGVKVHTIELWDEQGVLVAGELGTSVGGCYTALSGFSNRAVKSSGTIQMLATAKILEASGFGFWDMGMPIDYKSRMGAKTIVREDFLQWFAEEKTNAHVQLAPMLPQNAQAVISQAPKHCQNETESGAADGEAVIETELDVESMSVKELKQMLNARGVDFSGCVEKSEMQQLLFGDLKR
eukprot:TRINITY_DN52475_c0_g1_i1.p1 TRINITY_DN52475_c0_g1~~TRINITY_DN52475_c0_g1_i1.p1  ORF type:complete len:222 (-),score=50.90 TRINITY_DN52475_c0_g1_i1:173-838(-)